MSGGRRRRTRSRSRSAAARRAPAPPASSVSGATIANSSPPIRAVISIARVTSPRILARRAAARDRRPDGRSASLKRLKSSRSSRISASGRPVRSARASSRANSSRSARRLVRPVSGIGAGSRSRAGDEARGPARRAPPTRRRRRSRSPPAIASERPVGERRSGPAIRVRRRRRRPRTRRGPRSPCGRGRWRRRSPPRRNRARTAAPPRGRRRRSRADEHRADRRSSASNHLGVRSKEITSRPRPRRPPRRPRPARRSSRSGEPGSRSVSQQQNGAGAEHVSPACGRSWRARRAPRIGSDRSANRAGSTSTVRNSNRPSRGSVGLDRRSHPPLTSHTLPATPPATRRYRFLSVYGAAGRRLSPARRAAVEPARRSRPRCHPPALGRRELAAGPASRAWSGGGELSERTKAAPRARGRTLDHLDHVGCRREVRRAPQLSPSHQAQRRPVASSTACSKTTGGRPGRSGPASASTAGAEFVDVVQRADRDRRVERARGRRGPRAGRGGSPGSSGACGVEAERRGRPRPRSSRRVAPTPQPTSSTARRWRRPAALDERGRARRPRWRRPSSSVAGEPEACGPLARPGDDLGPPSTTPAAHQRPARDDGRVDDRARGRVDEPGVERAQRELAGRRRGRAGSRPARRPRAAPAEQARAPPVAIAERLGRGHRGRVARLVLLQQRERLRVGEQVERVVGARAVGAEADLDPDLARVDVREDARRRRASGWRPGW